ncbi:MAG: hypothetical protein JRJ73_13270 [Deltaproteobacteria bacterium]|nr:hypothetical protein [Deltaproteobacteria bacterium]
MKRPNCFMYLKFIVLLLLLVFLISSCSDQRFSTTGPHPEGFILTHALDANEDIESCTICHDADFSGIGNAISCFACHIDGPPFVIHPSDWTNAFYNHRGFYTAYNWTTCAASACHGTDLTGGRGSGETGPSCFLAECHAAGPPPSHSLPYIQASDHGQEAREGQFACRNCHGQPPHDFDGGFIADPSILNKSTGNCSSAACHPAAKAHPTNWQGTNEDLDVTYASSHRVVTPPAVDTGCSLCHKTDEPGTGPMAGAPSCFSPYFINSDGSATGCHSGGPAALHPIPFAEAVLHGPPAESDLVQCQQCHADPFDGGPGSNPRFNVPLGNLVNGCENCHDVNTAHPVPWMGIPLSNHNLAGNLSIACALCHGVNLEGDVGPACEACHTAGSPVILSNCSSCHNHPPDGALPASDFRPNREGAHDEHEVLRNVTDNCAACHNGAGTESENHFDNTEPADVSIFAVYNAKTAAYGQLDARQH